MYKNKTFKLFFIFAVLAILAGCCRAPKPQITHVDPAIALYNKLNKFIIAMPHQTRDKLVLAIPDSKLFNPNSANLTGNGGKLLNTVAAFLACYEKEDVHIIGYIYAKSNNDMTIVKSLAKEQAQRVANYLGKKNADMRVAYADGYILPYPSSSFSGSNDHVEIHLQVFSRQYN